MSVMAKIGNLEVDTLNIANDAVTLDVAGTGSLVVANDSGLPIQLFYRGTAEYIGTTSGASGTINVKITRSRDGWVAFDHTLNFSGNNSQTESISCGVLDTSATTSETYTIATVTTPSGIEVTRLRVVNAAGLARAVKV